MVLAGFVSICSLIAAPLLGNEPTAPKQEPSTVPAPPASKPQAQGGETKPPAKGSTPPADAAGKEAAPVKPEPSPAPAPPSPKPRSTDGDTKPSTKLQSPANGGTASKQIYTVQPPPEITGKDGAPMVFVPAGEFIMGSDKGDDDEQPIHRVFLDSFYIDKFEVTNSRYARFVKAMLLEPPWSFADKDTPIVRADRPVRWVNWMEALGYCLWAGKRLPTEAEWEKAARGPDGRIYPWGNEAPTSAQAVFGLKEGTDTVSQVGNRDAGKSPYGVHDMAGNLYEWTMDWYDDRYYSDLTAINPRGPMQGTSKAQRGGSYTNTPYRLRSTFRTKGDPMEQEHNVGFRCAQDALK
ncbi:MAG TPA: SUMF1/EgtB/PvdO family nonheme iron enzyme [Nitrospira sp.]